VAVRIIGHTSKTGDPGFNQILSEQRAQSVVNYLRGLGLKNQLVAEGKGFLFATLWY
jgi:OOP family OmpA-OmpF porin